MQEATKKLIRTAVRNVLKNTDLTEYRIRKIVKGELEDPGSWLHPGHGEDREWCIANYYRNLTSNSVFASFTTRLYEKYQINYFNHLNK